MRIFYVDDDENDRVLVARAVRTSGLPIIVEEAEGGEAALALLRLQEKLPDVLLLDIKMPGMSGFEFLERLERAGRGTMPVVMFSSSEQPKDVQRAGGMGVHAFCIKPAGAPELIEFLHRLYWGWMRSEIPCEWPKDRHRTI